MEEPEILVARNHDPAVLRHALRAGELDRLRRGAYRPAALVDTWVARRRRATDQVHAVHRQLRADHVFSHLSAALLWDVPLWELPDRVHVLQSYRAGSTAADDVARHRPFPASWVELDGVPVTTRAQTVVDCLRSLPPWEGLVVADWALRSPLRIDEAAQLLGPNTSVRGRRRARLLLSLADGGAESPWESYVRYLALRTGLPRPRTQCPVKTADGTFRTDIGWPELGVHLEFDGRVKYVDGALGTGYDAGRTLFEEKRREDAIMAATGIRLTRLTAQIAQDPGRTTRQVLALFPAVVRRTARVEPLLPLPTPRRARRG